MENKIVYIKKTSESDNTTIINAMFNQEIVGYISYKIHKSQAWLYKIEFSSKFRKYGIGSALIKIMEDDCACHRVWNIEGKYYPENASNEEVSGFYKHGFSIYKDGYETLVGKFSPSEQNLENLLIKEECSDENENIK